MQNRTFLTFFILLPQITYHKSTLFRIERGVVQWVSRLTGNPEVVGSSPIKGPRCFLEQETVPLLLSTGWFQEQIQA